MSKDDLLIVLDFLGACDDAMCFVADHPSEDLFDIWVDAGVAQRQWLKVALGLRPLDVFADVLRACQQVLGGVKC